MVLRLWPASTVATAAPTAPAATTTAFPLSSLSPALTLEWTVALHRECCEVAAVCCVLLALTPLRKVMTVYQKLIRAL